MLKTMLTLAMILLDYSFVIITSFHATITTSPFYSKSLLNTSIYDRMARV